MPSAEHSDAFNSLADARRQFRPGRRVRITDHRYPDKSFESTIRRNGIKEFAMDCPRQGPGALTWRQWPKALDFDPATGDVFWTRDTEGWPGQPAGQVRTRVFTFTLLD